ncbi:ATP-dependent DNA helicase recQ [unidentified eubacterium SCB49]|nr:ATP-dependent DNA helicase recQ [unidentified eubacterium SCB49]
MKNPNDILKQYWGFSSFRPLQLDIIQSVMDGRDTVALLPTGGGKSVCFQVPALAMDGICIVVSPLVALMNDQVTGLKSKGIRALSITGGLSFANLMTTLDNAKHGNYKFLYLSPERLQQETVQNAIKQMPVNCIAIDEAHCISQWGNDFRPAYKNITILRELCPLAPVIALTATATPEVLKDTIAELKMELPAIFKKSFVRNNIAYQVLQEDDKLYRIEQLLKNNTGNTIIYIRNRKGTVQLSEELNSLGFRSQFFHGGLTPKEKEKKLEDWKAEITPIMVATNAFGMGIDHPNVRFVIHTQLAESLESYFQEAGRAGRDGKYAQAVLIYNTYDKTIVKKQHVDSLASVNDLKLIYRKLNNYFQISYGEGTNTKHSFGFAKFCKTYQLNTLITYNGLQALDRLGILQLSKEFGRKSTLHFTAHNDIVLDYFSGDPLASVIGKTILRIYGGVFDSPTQVNLDFVQSKTGQSIPVIEATLQKMEAQGLCTVTLQQTDASITFLVPREDDKSINVISREAKALNDKKKAQVAAVLKYVTNTETCKSVQLVTYFGETTATACGICSVCTMQKTTTTKTEILLIKKAILNELELSNKSSRELTENLTFAASKILNVLRLLSEQGIIGIDAKNLYFIV